MGGMAEEPKLIKISKTAYGCSACPDFKIVKPDKKTARDEWEQQIVHSFVDHFRKRHGGK
jgi:hypothetical protein